MESILCRGTTCPNHCNQRICRQSTPGTRGRGVRHLGAEMDLFPLPANPILRILQQDSLAQKLVPDPIGAREVPLPLRLRTLCNERLDLRIAKSFRAELRDHVRVNLIETAFTFCPLQRGFGPLRITVLEHSEDRIESTEQ